MASEDLDDELIMNGHNKPSIFVAIEPINFLMRLSS